MAYKHWPILVKFLSLLLALGAFCLFASLFATSKMRAIGQDYDALINGPARASVSLARANRSLSAYEAGLHYSLTTLTDAENADARTKIASAEADFRKFIDQSIAADPAHATTYRGLQRRFDGLATDAGVCGATRTLALASTSTEGNIEIARNHMHPVCMPAIGSLRKAIAGVVDATIKANSDAAERNRALTAQAVFVTNSTIIGGVAVMLVVAVWLTLIGVIRPLQALTEVTAEMSHGRLDVTVPSQDRHDELGKVARTVEVFRKGLEETEILRRDAETQKPSAGPACCAWRRPSNARSAASSTASPPRPRKCRLRPGNWRPRPMRPRFSPPPCPLRLKRRAPT